MSSVSRLFGGLLLLVFAGSFGTCIGGIAGITAEEAGLIPRRYVTWAAALGFCTTASLGVFALRRSRTTRDDAFSTCRRYDYDLRSVTRPECPECGHRIGRGQWDRLRSEDAAVPRRSKTL